MGERLSSVGSWRAIHVAWVPIDLHHTSSTARFVLYWRIENTSPRIVSIAAMTRSRTVRKPYSHAISLLLVQTLETQAKDHTA